MCNCSSNAIDLSFQKTACFFRKMQWASGCIVSFVLRCLVSMQYEICAFKLRGIVVICECRSIRKNICGGVVLRGVMKFEAVFLLLFE